MRPQQDQHPFWVAKCLVKTAVALFVSGWIVARPALANDSWERHELTAHFDSSVTDLELRKRYALGISRFDLDAHTEIIGWRLNDVWYFGRQDGLDSGLTLVWQQNLKQVSLSKDGLRLTRRF